LSENKKEYFSKEERVNLELKQQIEKNQNLNQKLQRATNESANHKEIIDQNTLYISQLKEQMNLAENNKVTHKKDMTILEAEVTKWKAQNDQ